MRSRLIAFARTERLAAFLADLKPAELALIRSRWPVFAHDYQLPPPGDWTTWTLLGGRGAGKTRAGAEWVGGLACGADWLFGDRAARIALVGETFADVRDVMIDGPSGILAATPAGQRPAWQRTRKRLEWPNGAIALAFSAEDPEALRGPQFDAAWVDEVGKWKQADAAWDMLQFGLRLGGRPRQLVTTTPRPTPLVKRLIADPRGALTRARTAQNAFNLAPAFLDAVVGRYAGTRLGRQELDGELVEDRPDALWTRAMIEAGREEAAPPLVRVVVAVDPPATSSRQADACGLVAAGIDEAGIVHVLADATASGLRPAGWAEAAIALYRRHEADALVIEVNQGGEMATAILTETDPTVPVAAVRATRGKYLRAEPVAALYEQGRVRHRGSFPALEDEMCDFGPGGLSTGRSPDRLDALVWAVTHLALTPKGRPRVRAL